MMGDAAEIKGSTVLVVDDNPANLSVIVDCLAEQGCDVIVARDGETGLKLARQNCPDLILLDVVLPGMDGFEVCRRLKADKQTEEVSVIFMTIISNTEEKVKGFHVGGVDYITKPFQQEEVLARVSAHLHSRKLTRDLEEAKQDLERRVAERTAELVCANTELEKEIIERRRAEEEVRLLNQGLEQRISDRTARLEAANKELESFAYSVSHDLRAPLRHIDGFLDLFKARITVTLDEQSQRYLASVSANTERMGHLIDDLLAFSRMSRQEMAEVSVDLNGLVRDVIQELKPDMHDRVVHWKLSVLPVVVGDQSMLHIVLVNMLSNALKATRRSEPAEIEIGSACQDGECAIFVRDNGVGFDPRYSDKLFGAFQRLHSMEEFEGTGIGLANVRQIIDRHGGRTWAEGAVGRGATFYFSLPVPDRATG